MCGSGRPTPKNGDLEGVAAVHGRKPGNARQRIQPPS
jgi:hypothetical protein